MLRSRDGPQPAQTWCLDARQLLKRVDQVIVSFAGPNPRNVEDLGLRRASTPRWPQADWAMGASISRDSSSITLSPDSIAGGICDSLAAMRTSMSRT